MPTGPRFVADAMLGSLARKLRIFGFDTLYFREGPDLELELHRARRGSHHSHVGQGPCRPLQPSRPDRLRRGGKERPSKARVNGASGAFGVAGSPPRRTEMRHLQLAPHRNRQRHRRRATVRIGDPTPPSILQVRELQQALLERRTLVPAEETVDAPRPSIEI